MRQNASSDKSSIKFKNTNLISLFNQYDERSFYRMFSDLDMLATHFIKRSYLEDLTELPRMQDVPGHEFMVGYPSCVFVSYPWRDHNQPNDDILNAIRSFIPNQDEVGLWIDYCCLPQRPRFGTDDRTDKEKQFFKSQLSYIPTILLKSQLMVLWDLEHTSRAWCVTELLLSDIFRNLIMKQIYHCKDRLSDAVVYFVQTYNPTVFCMTGGVIGKPVAKILLPHDIKNLPTKFYNSLLEQLGMAPTLLTTLLKHTEMEHINRFFDENRLSCTNKDDILVLKELLFKVCQFAGSYDATTIKWSDKIPCSNLLPYIMANLSDFTVDLINYRFSD